MDGFSTASNQVKNTGKYLVFAVFREYIAVYDVYNDGFCTIYVAEASMDLVSNSNKLEPHLPIGTVITG